MSTQEKQNENYRLRTISSLKGYVFVVEKYQRGYKWEISQIEDLLYDISTFDKSKQAFYCLQPIVITKKIEEGILKYELIDGQQRLTTIFIILRCLEQSLFDIEYRTRPKSDLFLDSIQNLPVYFLEEDKRTLYHEKRNEINDAWGTYIEDKSDNDNVDTYHFFTTFQIVQNWVSTLSISEKDFFLNKLLYDTQVIWYDIKSDLESEKIFINFNQGKIHLEQAELIKALFVLSIKEETNTEIRAFKTNQFAEEWNTIENQLQDDKFWFFVSNDTSVKRKSNRIDLLFDIIKEKPKSKQSNLHSYYSYLSDFNSNSCLSEKDWQEVRDLFSLLDEWYKDRAIYHLLGLIIYFEIKTTTDIYKEYLSSSDKFDFKAKAKTWLIKEINYNDSSSKYYLFSLSYKTYDPTLRILILFNIATYQKSDPNYRFPFDKLKSQSWSLEHIHAQNAEDFETIKEVKEWIEDITVLIEDELLKGAGVEELDYIKGQLENLKSLIKESKGEDIIKRIQMQQLKTVSSLINQKMDVDSIKNLCLLDGPTNSALGNSNFRKKREDILQIDKEGLMNQEDKVFIPICTKYVFLKYYALNSNEIQFTHWGHQDRDDYINSMDESLKKYLK